MSPRAPKPRPFPTGFPRVSGDEPRVRTPEAGEDMFSPRERG